ncbi:MFS transporter [Acholeplasma granularum]|uniref:MFS transporter n=1 Tax=Acholeplasma granularum TaxID=264635 RepID=UPI000470843F|nr:MFS transporter [Acholeplasma granularum]
MKEKTFGKKIAFAAADILGGGSFNIINFLYTGFLVLAVGLSPYYAGLIILLARIWDAVIDPIMGYISDKTKSRWGKRRVYLIFVSPLLVISLYLLFYPYNFEQEILKVIACLASYLLFTTVQSAIMVPYYSLGSEISSDYHERASYNSVRLGFSIFASIICVAVPGLIISSFEDQSIGYQVMSLTFGVIFAVSTMITGIFAKEEIITEPTKAKFNFKDLLKPLKLKSYRQYLYLFLVVQMCMAIMSGLFFFYIDFYITKTATFNGSTTSVGLISAALMFGMQIVALPFYLKTIEKFGKTFTYRLGAFIWIIVALILLLVPQDLNQVWIIYLLAALMGFGISGPGLIPHTMFGDVVDAGQLVFEERLDGQMGGFTNFVNQISQAIGLALSMFILGLAGFVESDLTNPPLNPSQPENALLAIKLIMSLAPLLLMTIGIIVSHRYKIDAQMQKEIRLAIKDSTNIDELVKAL